MDEGERQYGDITAPLILRIYCILAIYFTGPETE